MFTTRPGNGHVPAPDLVKRDFTAPAPNRLRVMEYTYVPAWAGMVYVAFVIDVYSRMIVSWSIAASMRTDLVMTPLKHAVWRRDTLPDELITHSDPGSQNLGSGGRRDRCAAIDRHRRRFVRPRDGRVGQRALEDRTRLAARTVADPRAT